MTPAPVSKSAKPLRPSIVPSIPKARIAALLASIRSSLLKNGCSHLVTNEEFLGAIILALATDGGITGKGTIWVLRNIDAAELTSEGVLLMRSVRASGDKATSMQLPAIAEMILRIALMRLPRLEPDAVFTEADSAGQRRRARAQLEVYWTSLKRSLQVSSDVKWVDGEAAARILAYQRGIPPVLITLMGETPAPQHPWWAYGLLGVPIDLATEDDANGESRISPGQFGHGTQSVAGARTRRKKELGANVIDKFFERLREICPGKPTQNSLVRANSLLDQLLSEIAGRWCATSSVHLMLRWAVHRLHGRGRPTPATVEGYTRRLWHKALAAVPGHQDLTRWREAEYRGFCEKVMENVEDPETVNSTRDLIRDLSRFASEHGFWTCFSPSTLNEMTLDNPRRARVIGLRELDLLIQGVLSQHTRHALELAAFLIVMFWGGMRPKALERLTLRRVDIRDGEVNLRVPRVKTPASRAIIPLHLIAPEHHVVIVRRFVERRRNEMPRAKLSSAKLFGMSGVEVNAAKRIAAKLPTTRRRRSRPRLVARHHWDEIRKAAVDVLKNAFGPEIVLYSLRHSCASWQFVRLMALGCADIRSLIVDGNHVVFDRDAEKRFRELVSAGEFGVPASSTPSTGLIAVLKLFGHAEYETFFSHYCHTIHVVQAGYQRAADRELRAQRLSNDAFGAITGLRSSASLANLDKTVGGVLTRLREKSVSRSAN